jgi:hypothetical protein
MVAGLAYLVITYELEKFAARSNVRAPFIAALVNHEPHLEPDTHASAEGYEPLQPSPLAPWERPAGTVFARLASEITRWLTVTRDRATAEKQDPVLNEMQTRLVDIANSAIAEHGKLIERAVLECLNERDDLRVWCEPKFYLSHGVVSMHAHASEGAFGHASLKYGDGDPDLSADKRSARAVQVDVILYDERARKIVAYEIKRNSDNPQSARNLACVKAQLIDYGKHRGLDPISCDAFTINYYGDADAKDEGRLTRHTINAHFGCDIAERVDDMTIKFRADVQTLLAGAAS